MDSKGGATQLYVLTSTDNDKAEALQYGDEVFYGKDLKTSSHA